MLEDDLAKSKAREDELSHLLGAKTRELDDKTLRLRALEDEINKLRLEIDGRELELNDLNRKYSAQVSRNFSKLLTKI